MNRSVTTLVLCVVVLTTVALGACTAKNPDTSDTSKSNTAAPINEDPHETPEDYDKMSSTAWANHFETLKFDSNLIVTATVRSCTKPNAHEFDCPLRFVPVKNVHVFKYKNANPKGTVLGMIHNYGDKPELTYSLPAGHRALWVVRSRDGDTTTQFIDIDAGYTKTLQQPLRFKLCGVHENKKANSGFYYCDNSPGEHPKKPTTLGFFEHNTPPWVTCAEGCCNADGDATGHKVAPASASSPPTN